MKTKSIAVLMGIGAVLAFCIPIFIGVLMYLVDEPEYMPNPTRLMPSEISQFSSTEQEGAVNSENMFHRTISGSFKLADPNRYEKIEVLAALYDERGEFLQEYAASKKNIKRANDLVSFEINVYEPQGMFEVSGYKYEVQGE